MRRVWVVIASAVLVAAVSAAAGSPMKSAWTRPWRSWSTTRRLKKNLMDPPNEKKFQDLAIYLRAPKDQALAKTGQLPVTEGQFDLDASFNDEGRLDPARPGPGQDAQEGRRQGRPAAPAASPAGRVRRRRPRRPVQRLRLARRPADAEVQRGESQKGNRFKRLIFAANDKEVKLYTYKQGNHEVALIFVYDPKLEGAAQLEDRPLSRLVRHRGEGRPGSTRGGAAEEEADSGPTGAALIDRSETTDGPSPPIARRLGPSRRRSDIGRIAGRQGCLTHPGARAPLGQALLSARLSRSGLFQAFGSDDSQADRASLASGSFTSSSRTIMTSGGASMPSRTWLRSTLTTLIRMSGPI